MVCPVCQKACINDEAQSCPQCNSDLSQLHLLARLENKFKSWKKIKSFFLFSSIVLIILLAVTLYSKMKIEKPIVTRNISNDNSDSATYYRQQYKISLNIIDSIKNTSATKPLIKYKVRPGDNLSKIAILFYNDISKASKIASDNKLKNMNLITTNQILKIEINE